MKVKLAEALLRRKELEGKVKQLAAIKQSLLIDTVVQRIKVQEGFDDLTIKYNKVSVKEVTAEFDFYSRALRLCDAAIQQMNWTVELDEAEKYMSDAPIKEVEAEKMDKPPK